MTRSPCELRLKRGTWSPEEDHKLIAYVERYGHWNWNYVPIFAGSGLSRSGKSCRLRWKNYLRPNLKHGDFSIAEEEIIIKMQREFGNRWAMIASKLAGRTDNDIKNYWNTRLRKQTKYKSPPSSSESESGAETFDKSMENSDNQATQSSTNLVGFGLEDIIQTPYSPQLSGLTYDDLWESMNQVESDASSVIVEAENVISDPFDWLELGRLLEEPFQYGPLFDDNGTWQC